jgi:hypothetical protein
LLLGLLSFDKGPLQEKIANSIEELQKVIFGRGFGGITDIEVGPDDGYLYGVFTSSSGGNCNPRSHDNKACIYYHPSLIIIIIS